MPGISLITITAGPDPDPEDVAPLAVRLEGLLGEARERGLPLACIARRHGRTVASSVVAGPCRSLDPRLPVLVGLGAASDSAPVVDLMTDAVRAAAADAGAPGPARARSTASRCPRARGRSTDPARTVARRIGSPGRAHGPVRDRRLAAGGDQPRPGRRGGRPRRDASWSSGGEARALGPRRRASSTDEERRPPDEVLTRPAGLRGPDRAGGRHRAAAGAAVRAH